MHSADERIDEIMRRIYMTEAAYQALLAQTQDLADQIRDLREDLLEVARAARS